MKLVVGLGNPGSEFEETRHNAGFKVMDLLATECSAQFRKKNHVFRGTSYDYAKTNIGKDEVVILKPLTFMNLSGSAVKAALDWFKINSQDLVLVHDDVSLPLGKIRIQKGAGAGGQHGVESVIENLKGSKEFNRIKVGVGPDPGGHTRHKFVLAPVPEADRELYIKVIVQTKNAIKFLLKQGVDKAANKYNGKDLAAPEKPKKPKPKKDNLKERSQENSSIDKEEKLTKEKKSNAKDSNESNGHFKNNVLEDKNLGNENQNILSIFFSYKNGFDSLEPSPFPFSFIGLSGNRLSLEPVVHNFL